MILVRRSIGAVTFCAVLLAAFSCADSASLGRYIDQDASGGEAPSFTAPPDAASDAAPAPALLCEGTECPSPYATCGSTVSTRCGVNLSNDVRNCGACGNACPDYSALHMTARCVDGTCVPECISTADMCGVTTYKDCNGLVDDGCETPTTDDPKNCGGCGHVCDDGLACIKGKCGCPEGMTDCPGCSRLHLNRCVDLQNDDLNCGVCELRCPTSRPDGCSPMPTNTQYGCGHGACATLKCREYTADCNHDLGLGCASDGCEVNLMTDPNNCGACGHKCAPGQECRSDNGVPECFDACEASGKTRCPFTCADLLSDPLNCGACGLGCPERDHQIAQCRKGVCSTQCTDGFADCDGNPMNGCEVNLATDQSNCGACGVQCNIAGGQPCVEGKCLMVECDAGVITQ